jgi:hypothetical protein
MSRQCKRILRHQNWKTTPEIYAKAMSEDKLQAQGMFLEQLFSQDKKNPPQAAISTKDLKTLSLQCILCSELGSSASNCG